MRELKFTQEYLERMMAAGPGMFVSFPVKVSWPELQLTEGQVLANAAALADGRADPYPDRSFFNITIERAAVSREGQA